MSAGVGSWTTMSTHCTAQSAVFRCTAKWAINDFNHCISDGQIIVSPKFSVIHCDQAEWYLTLSRGSSFYYMLCLYFTSQLQPLLIKYQIFIVDSKGIKQRYPKSDNVSFQFLRSKQEILFAKDELKSYSELCPSGTLAIVCDIDLTEFTTITESPTFNKINPGLSDDMRTIFQHQKFTDVILQAGERSFEAHKAILAARSSVFAAMFENDMKENKENKVDITDVSAEVLEVLLTYIYTDEEPKLGDIASDVLAEADKYALGNLKIMCEEILYDNLDIDNAAEIFILANRHNADQLKNLILPSYGAFH